MKTNEKLTAISLELVEMVHRINLHTLTTDILVMHQDKYFIEQFLKTISDTLRHETNKLGQLSDELMELVEDE